MKYTSGHVLNRICQLSAEATDEEWTEGVADRVGEYSWWSLKYIPISRFRLQDKRDKETIEHYASLKTNPPPIVAIPVDGKYETIDGEHRLQAAMLRGDKKIKAYVPDISPIS